MQGGQFDTEDNLTPRTIWHHHKFYISTIVWPRNMITNILISTIYLFDWKLSCIMSLYQIWARQGPHIKTYLISWQLFGPKISLEICILYFFLKLLVKTFHSVKLSYFAWWCQIVLFCMMVSNCPRCQIVLFAFMVSNCPTCHYGVKLSEVSNGPRCRIVRSVKWS